MCTPNPNIQSLISPYIVSCCGIRRIRYLVYLYDYQACCLIPSHHFIQDELQQNHFVSSLSCVHELNVFDSRTTTFLRRTKWYPRYAHKNVGFTKIMDSHIKYLKNHVNHWDLEKWKSESKQPRVLRTTTVVVLSSSCCPYLPTQQLHVSCTCAAPI